MNVWKLSDRAETRLLREPRMKWLVQRESGALLFSEKTRSVARAETTQAERYTVDEARWAKARERLLLSWSATVGDPLPADVLDELQLLLYARPEMLLEYMGRGRYVNDMHLPVGKEDMFSFDIAGGKRKYLFRTLRAGGADERLSGMNERFAVYKRWIADPQAKVVLSMGGGGFRMFAATAVLKSVDALLDGNRSQISEVWGSSGGAFLGYVYAMGFDPTVIDELGYDLYHGRKSHLTDGSMMSLIRSRLRTYRRALRGQRTDPDMEAWLEELDRREPAHTRKHKTRGFFPVAANPNRGGVLSALAAPEHIPDYCQDFILPCNPRDAVAASTAVPFVLRAQQNITSVGGAGDSKDTWVDGSVTDENPLVLPFVKWMRERERFPDTTPQKLKILLVNLNLRSSESAAVRLMTELPILKRLGIVHQMPKLLDMVLDSKTNASIMMLTETANVEILSLKLLLGRLSVKDPRDIAATIRAGRSIDAWQIATFRKGF
jgi:predicted acylesterase/phospholipase RssA